MNGWAIWLPESSCAALGDLRLESDIEAIAAGDGIWIRGTDLRDDLALKLRQLPGGKRFTLNEQNELTPLEARLPIDLLPSGNWLPIQSFLEPRIPHAPALMVALKPEKLSLVRSAAERSPSAMTTDLSSWRAYAEEAPLVRLVPLKFAASRAGRVLIIGSPLPPLRGEFYWEQSGLYVAAGYEWSPQVQVDVVRQVLRLESQDLAIWHEDGTWERIESSAFVAARRAAVRATAESFSHE